MTSGKAKQLGLCLLNGNYTAGKLKFKSCRRKNTHAMQTIKPTPAAKRCCPVAQAGAFNQ